MQLVLRLDGVDGDGRVGDPAKAANRRYERTPLGDDVPVPSLRCRVVRWVSDDPQPGWVETQFRGADGEVWQMFDKPSIFERPDGPALTVSTEYPVEVEMPVTVHSKRASAAGRVALISLPWGLDHELGDDTFEVLEADLHEDE